MLLKSLDIHGFKTFPDKTTLTFNDEIVAVVGPNGSGKSNVSDALRWVLGEQSTKALRCSKMEDVIFKGTTKRKALGYAEVTLNIDNTERRLNFDSDSIAVTRRFYRSGDSEYLINKASVRLKDINELFMDTGLGRDGYSMIGQGKIDSIVAAKSEERREIFEEASGISKYRYRKEEAERRLGRAEENLVRLRDILRELEERIGPLKIQAEKAEKFIAYDGEKVGLEVGIWVETIKKSDKLLREFDEKISIEEASLKAKESEIESLLLKEENNLRLINETAARIDLERNEASLLDELFIKTEGEINLLLRDIEFNKLEIERAKADIDNIEKSSERNLNKLNNNLKLIDEKNGLLKIIKDEELAVLKESENNRIESDKLTSEIELITKKNESKLLEISEISSVLSSLEALKNEINLRKESLSELINQTEKKGIELKKRGEELKNLKEATINSLNTAKNTLSGYEMKIESRKRKANALREEFESLSLSASEEARRAKILEDLERNYEGFTQSVKAVMRESERQYLKGILGPVTKIITTAGEYAVAIETALSASMQNIVTETEQDAKNAIYYLKKNNLGRATFLPVNVINGSVIKESEFKHFEGFVGVAGDLCTCESKFTGIKNSLLGRTIVAEDIDSALFIAKNTGYRYKIVTLDGQQINSGGSLTGGSLNKNSGLLSRRSEIERIKKKAEALKIKSDAVSLERKKYEEELRLLEAEKSLLTEEISKLYSKLAVNENEIKVNLKNICDNKDSFEALINEKNGVNDRTKSIENKIIENKLLLSEKEKLLSGEKESLDSLNLLRNRLSLEYSGIQEKLQNVRMRNFEINTELSLIMRENQAIKEQSEKENESKEILENKIKALNLKSESTSGEISIKEENLKTNKANSESKKEKVKLLSEKRNSLEAEASQIRIKERELSSDRELIVGSLSRLQEKRDTVNRDYENIIRKLWEDYELTRNEAEQKAIPIEDLSKAQRRLNELKSKIKALGSVNVGAVVEYKEVSERYQFLNTQVQDVEKSKIELNKLINELTGKMKAQFSVKFEEINRNFKKTFKEMFGGGDANLELSDDSDILNSGIEIKVHPPGKIVSHIEALSGGEKALVAISIYFAIMKVNPPPFCMLDEVEAALDDVNVRKFAEYLHGISDNTQFIVVTHRRGTMESADTLYGVTMQEDGVSKVLELKNREEIKNIEADAS